MDVLFHDDRWQLIRQICILLGALGVMLALAEVCL